jgi:RNA polymerase sigma factor (sigma-70 family)
MDFIDDDPLAVYLRELGKVAPVSAAEERELAARLRAGGEDAQAAAKRLLEGNLRMVVLIAERYQSSGIHLLDLIERGNERLFAALKTLSEGERFSVYAARCVERSIAEAAEAEWRQNKDMPAHDSLLQRITTDPTVRFGKACIRRDRITVEEILKWLLSGASQEEILADYPLDDLADIRIRQHRSRRFAPMGRPGGLPHLFKSQIGAVAAQQ